MGSFGRLPKVSRKTSATTYSTTKNRRRDQTSGWKPWTHTHTSSKSDQMISLFESMAIGKEMVVGYGGQCWRDVMPAFGSAAAVVVAASAAEVVGGPGVVAAVVVLLAVLVPVVVSGDGGCGGGGFPEPQLCLNTLLMHDSKPEIPSGQCVHSCQNTMNPRTMLQSSVVSCHPVFVCNIHI